MQFTPAELAAMLNALVGVYIGTNDGNLSTRQIRAYILEQLEQFYSMGWIDSPSLHFMFTVECEKHSA